MLQVKKKLVPQDEVLNGIAYDKENKKLYVTGKNWGKLFEIELIKKALEKYRGKRKYAAKELGISERTLYRKIKEYNLS